MNKFIRIFVSTINNRALTVLTPLSIIQYFYWRGGSRICIRLKIGTGFSSTTIVFVIIS